MAFPKNQAVKGREEKERERRMEDIKISTMTFSGQALL
jgi:hypothetical protein